MPEVSEITGNVASPELMPAGQLLSSSWQTFKVNWKWLVKLELQLFLVAVAAVIICAVPIVALIMAAGRPQGGIFVAGIGLGIIAVIAAIIGSIWLQIILMRSCIELDPAKSLKQRATESWPLVGGFFVTGLLVGLLELLGVMALIVPAIIFAVWFSQVNFVLLLERITGPAALGRSKSYVVGRWWAVAGRMALISIVSILASLPLSILSDAAEQMNNDALSTIFSLAGALLSVVITPLTYIYGYKLYQELRRTDRSNQVTEAAQA